MCVCGGVRGGWGCKLACVRACVRVLSVCLCACVCVRVRVHACMRGECVRACARARVCVCARARWGLVLSSFLFGVGMGAIKVVANGFHFCFPF